jgi:uncharacterized protein
MSKLLVFLFVLFCVWYIRRLLQASDVPKQARRREARPHSEVLRECRYCGILVPESESVRSDGEFFCSSEHAQAYSAKAEK